MDNQEQTNLIGLKRRYALCKICNSFTDEVLNEITLDIILRRITYEQIKEKYSPMLPEGVLKLNSMNINAHRKHSDPALIADEILRDRGEVVTEAEIVSELYAQRFKSEFNRIKVLKEVYRERLNNLITLQGILIDTRKEYKRIKGLPASVEKDQIPSLQKSIIYLTKEVDNIYSDIQGVLIKELNSEKGIGEGGITISNTIILSLETQLKGFIEQIVPYFLYTLFPNDIKKGKEVIKYLSTTLDNHIIPVLEGNRTIVKEIESKLN